MSGPNPITEPRTPEQLKRRQKKRKTAEKPLSPKQRQVIRAYADPNSPTHGNATRSAIEAGYSKTSAHNTGNRIVRKGDGERELTRIFEAAGVTTEKLGKTVKQGLGAHYDQAFIHQKTGEIVYAKRRPDYNIRMKAARLAAEFRGDLAPKEINVKVAVLATRIQAARRREYERTPPPIVAGPDDKESDDITPME